MMRTVVGILLIAGFVTAVFLVGLNQNKVTCEVCMSYRGRQLCERASAIDHEQAMMQATTSACTQISGGVTDGIRCNATPPASSHCTE